MEYGNEASHIVKMMGTAHEGTSEDHPSHPEHPEHGKHVAAEAMMHAMHSKDVDGMRTAMEDFIECYHTPGISSGKGEGY